MTPYGTVLAGGDADGGASFLYSITWLLRLQRSSSNPCPMTRAVPRAGLLPERLQGGTRHSFSFLSDSTARSSGWRAQGSIALPATASDEDHVVHEFWAWVYTGVDLLEQSAGLPSSNSSGHSHSTTLVTVQTTHDLPEGCALTEAVEKRTGLEMEQHFAALEKHIYCDVPLETWLYWHAPESPCCGCSWTKSVDNGGFVSPLEQFAGQPSNDSSGHSHNTTFETGAFTRDLPEGDALTSCLESIAPEPRCEWGSTDRGAEADGGTEQMEEQCAAVETSRDEAAGPEHLTRCRRLWTVSAASGEFANQEEFRAVMTADPAVPSQLFVLAAQVPEPRTGSVEYGLSAKQEQALVLLAGLQDVRCKYKRVKKETRDMLHNVCGIEKKTLKKWCKNRWTVHCSLAGCSC